MVVVWWWIRRVWWWWWEFWVPRALVKYVLHILTGQCELERLCARRSYLDVVDMLQVEQSIMRSKQLASLHLLRDVFDVEHTLDVVIGMKRIYPARKDFGRVKSNLRVCLDNIQRVNQLIEATSALTRTSFDHSDPDHQHRLDRLWEALRPGVRRSGMRTKEWTEIGFQGVDPATDLRGMGMLALHDLCYLAQHYEREARTMLAGDPTGSIPSYPFAITGINMTSLTLQLLRERRLSPFLYRHGYHLVHFHEAYCRLFRRFDEFWIQSRPHTVMDFGDIRKRFLACADKFLTEEHQETQKAQSKVD